jgi:hypothetical protein
MAIERIKRRRLSAASAILLIFMAGWPGRAQAPSVDELIRRALAPKPSDTYTMRADFDALLAVRYADGASLTATARGTLTESHRAGQPLRRTLTIRELHLPVVLRPFTRPVQRIVKERIAAQPDELMDVHAHDFFLLDDAAEDLYTIGGVRRDIVTNAMAAYRAPQGESGGDGEARRSVAKWLFTSPVMKTRIVHPGPPYALEAVVDAQGLLRAFTVYYNWGTLRTQIAYAIIGGAPVWDRIQSDVATDLPTFGHATGEVTISLSNECLDCSATGFGPAGTAREVAEAGRSR